MTLLDMPNFELIECIPEVSSQPEVFLGEVALKICSKFTGEHPCRSEISIKLFCKLEEKRRHWVCFVYRIVFLSCCCKIKNHSFFCYIMQRIKRTFNIAEVKGEL